MTTELWIKIISAMITIMCALVTAFVIPYIKSKVSAERLAQLDYFATKAVRCAEQLYTPEEWKEKKQYVMNYLATVLNESLDIRITYDEMNAIVEGIVNEIKH